MYCISLSLNMAFVLYRQGSTVNKKLDNVHFFHVEIISPFPILKCGDNANMCYQNIALFVYPDQPNTTFTQPMV